MTHILMASDTQNLQESAKIRPHLQSHNSEYIPLSENQSTNRIQVDIKRNIPKIHQGHSKRASKEGFYSSKNNQNN